MTNNEQFFNLYNILDDLLREYYNNQNYNTSMIVRRINELKKSPSLKCQERGEKLDVIRNLRNSLAHVEKIDNEDNFQIRKSLITFLKNEIELLKNPLTAEKVCVPINQVLVSSLEDKIIEVANKMLDSGFTHIPVLVNGFLYGVFSENTIFSHFVKEKGLTVTNNTTIDEYKENIKITNHATECFSFVAKDTKIEKLIPMFSKKINGKRLAMLFVTNKGVENEKIIGIITSYDLLDH